MSIRITTAASALAAIRARQAVKTELQRRGEKVSHYAAKEISRMAQSYLALHQAELMPDCIARARAMILSGALGKRARAQLVTEYCKANSVTRMVSKLLQRRSDEKHCYATSSARQC